MGDRGRPSFSLSLGRKSVVVRAQGKRSASGNALVYMAGNLDSDGNLEAGNLLFDLGIKKNVGGIVRIRPRIHAPSKKRFVFEHSATRVGKEWQWAAPFPALSRISLQLLPKESKVEVKEERGAEGGIAAEEEVVEEEGSMSEAEDDRSTVLDSADEEVAAMASKSSPASKAPPASTPSAMLSASKASPPAASSMFTAQCPAGCGAVFRSSESELAASRSAFRHVSNYHPQQPEELGAKRKRGGLGGAEEEEEKGEEEGAAPPAASSMFTAQCPAGCGVVFRSSESELVAKRSATRHVRTCHPQHPEKVGAKRMRGEGSETEKEEEEEEEEEEEVGAAPVWDKKEASLLQRYIEALGMKKAPYTEAGEESPSFIFWKSVACSLPKRTINEVFLKALDLQRGTK